jgi:hypothetical protein
MDPKSRGGWDHPGNLVACCKRCNSKKKDRLFVDWLEFLTEKRSQLARVVYVEKHCYQPEEFIPKPSVITFGYREETPHSFRLNALIEELRIRQAEGTLTPPQALEAFREFNEMEPEEEPLCIPRQYDQLPDENGLLWACEYYSPGDISDEDWCCKERWYAYCEINSVPLNKGDRSI